MPGLIGQYPRAVAFLAEMVTADVLDIDPDEERWPTSAFQELQRELEEVLQGAINDWCREKRQPSATSSETP